jgi:hypothetical protein
VGSELDDPVDHLEGLGIEGDHAFGGEFAERDFQPRAVPVDLVDAVQLEIEHFPDPQPAGALQPQPQCGQLVVGMLGQRGSQPPIRVNGGGSGAAAAGAWGCRRGRSLSGAGRRPSPIR